MGGKTISAVLSSSFNEIHLSVLVLLEQSPVVPHRTLIGTTSVSVRRPQVSSLKLESCKSRRLAR